MDITGIGAAATAAKGIIGMFFPDKTEDEKNKLAASLALLQSQTELAKDQTAVNQVEAGSTRLFVAGWRPFIGWICGASLGFKYIGGPLLVIVSQSLGQPVAMPDLGIGELMPLLLGMLGLGAMRTVEKIKGAA